jgi:hypothetical protein
MCPRDQIFIQVDAEFYCVQDVIGPLLSRLAQKNNKENDQKNLRSCVGPYFGCTCLPKKIQDIWT